MSEMTLTICAEAEKTIARTPEDSLPKGQPSAKYFDTIPVHSLPGRISRSRESVPQEASNGEHPAVENPLSQENPETDVPLEESGEDERRRQTYRRRVVRMLRRYMLYSIETGRLPSLLGREIFRAQITPYTAVTFEDRVIFVHDVETCLNRLDEFSRDIIARHVLQEHDQAETGRLLNCAERTVRTYIPIALDLLSEIMLDLGLLERID